MGTVIYVDFRPPMSWRSVAMVWLGLVALFAHALIYTVKKVLGR